MNIILAFLFSLFPINNLDFFNNNLKIKVSSSYKIEIKNEQIKPSMDLIIRPVNTWVALFKIYYLIDDFKQKSLCLIYKIPFKKSLGILKIIELDNIKDKCTDHLLDQAQYHIGEISELSIDLKSDNKIDLQIKIKRIKHNFSVSLPHSMHNMGSPDVLLVPIINSNEKQLPFPAINDNERCHTLDENCNVIKNYECDNCQNGWYEVLETKCLKVRNKFCGPIKCGEKGQFACIRGLENIDALSNKYVCSPENKLGFCNRSLTLICKNKKSLICL